MRTFDEDLRKQIKINLKEIAERVAKANKCTANLEIRDGYPSVYNEPVLTKKVIEIAGEYLPARITSYNVCYTKLLRAQVKH